MKHTRIQDLAIAAVCIALGVILPQLFHGIPRAGMIFLPMHIPVLLCGFLVGPWLGLACGLITPLLSSLITGMPPAGPILVGMMVELAVYGLVAGLLFRVIKTKWLLADIYLALVGAMLAGRIVNAIMNALIFQVKNYNLSMWLAASFTTCLPGIAIQLLVIPALVVALTKAKLLPQRKPAQD